ncbi:MAG: LacI family DNA-binding transcriptional regulator [Gaiellales bacterium]
MKTHLGSSKNATLRDVASRAGVSVATASRVLSGSAAVRPGTRERVERAARELLYVAPGRTEATGAIGLLVPEFGNPVFAALSQSMETRATDAGFATIICNTGGSARREVDYVHMLLERRVDGMVFICAEVTDTRGEHTHYRQLLELGARLVFVNGGSERLPVTSVGVDERFSGRLATDHLLSLGHRRIGFAAGEEWALPARQKLRGRADALRAAGIDPAPHVAHTQFTVAGGRAALRELMAEPASAPTGVICSNDLIAIGVIQEAATRGLRVPDDLSVVGFDGIDAARWLRPSLTTVAQPIDEIAATTVDALRALIDDPTLHLPHYVFRPVLQQGGTTAPPVS